MWNVSATRRWANCRRPAKRLVETHHRSRCARSEEGAVQSGTGTKVPGNADVVHRSLELAPTRWDTWGTTEWRTPRGSLGLPFVVVARLQDDKVVPVHEIDQPMLVVDAPRPATGEHMAECFRLANAGEGLAQRVGEQAVQALQRLSVCRLPILVVLPAVRREDDPHWSRSWTRRSPA